MADKTYINGGIKEIEFNDGGSLMNARFDVKQLSQYMDEKGYVKIKIKKRREVGQYGDTHYAELDTWKPTNSAGEPGKPKPSPQQSESDDLPF